jgi:hypothetical protein
MGQRMLSDGNLRRRNRQPLEVLLQTHEAQAACGKLFLQIFGNGGFFVLSCRNVKCLDHEAGGSVTLEAL